MHRRSLDFHVNVQDYLDTEWTSMKFFLRRQLSKCVNECKAQASNAKKLVGNLKTSQNKQVDMGEYQDSGILEDSDGWDTDFDDEDEEQEEEQNNALPTSELKDPAHECSEEKTVTNDEVNLQNSELNNNYLRSESEDVVPTTNIGADTVVPQAEISNHVLSDIVKPKPPEKVNLPKPPPTKPLITALNRNNIPRPPLKRPPSQPPPPPIPQPLPSSTNLEGPQEDYEIPINPSSGAGLPQLSSVLSSSGTFHSHTSSPVSSNTDISNLGSTEDNQETYEIIEAPEENYEIVDALSTGDRPALPPRIQGCQFMTPPPLPEKPVKIHESSPLPVMYKKDLNALPRPWLARSALINSAKGESQENLSHTISESNQGGSNSLIGIRNNRKASPLPAVPVKTDRTIGSTGSCADTISLASTTDSHSSRASTPDKNAIEQPVNVQHVSILMNANEGRKTTPPPLPVRTVPVIPDTTAQNIANRPLPPVPALQLESTGQSESGDLYQQPWFHDIERQVAEEQVKILGQDGSYVVRPSKRAGQENPYTLTVLHEGRVFHLNIRLRPEGIYALGREKPREKTFPSVARLITFHQSEAILLTSRGEPAGKTTLLLYPKKN